MTLRIINKSGGMVSNCNAKLAMALIILQMQVWKNLPELPVDERTLQDYRIFLALKIAFNDVLGTLFSPTEGVDVAWHAHLLHCTLSYGVMVKALSFNRVSFVHHRMVTDKMELQRMGCNFRTALIAVNARRRRPSSASSFPSSSRGPYSIRLHSQDRSLPVSAGSGSADDDYGSEDDEEPRGPEVVMCA